jgi:mRNA-degrading endonuclease toxin of MazEF toxin-antitoxin module
MNRGDVILVRFPHSSGLRGKKRPAVVVQSDACTGAVSTLVVAEVTTNVKKTPERSQWNSMFNSRFQKG